MYGRPGSLAGCGVIDKTWNRQSGMGDGMVVTVRRGDLIGGGAPFGNDHA